MGLWQDFEWGGLPFICLDGLETDIQSCLTGGEGPDSLSRWDLSGQKEGFKHGRQLSSRWDKGLGISPFYFRSLSDRFQIIRIIFPSTVLNLLSLDCVPPPSLLYWCPPVAIDPGDWTGDDKYFLIVCNPGQPTRLNTGRSVPYLNSGSISSQAALQLWPVC